MPPHIIRTRISNDFLSEFESGSIKEIVEDLDPDSWNQELQSPC